MDRLVKAERELKQACERCPDVFAEYQSADMNLHILSNKHEYAIDVSVDGRDIIVKVPEDAQGNVTVTIEGKNYTAKVENGTAIINVPDLTPGKHNITVSYGDEKYSPEENSTVIDVVND